MSDDQLLEGTRAFWRDLGQGMVRGSVPAVDEAAKQVIGVAGILEGLYFHAVVWTGLRGQAAGWTLVAYLAPVALLLLGLAGAILVYFPGVYTVNVQSSKACRVAHELVLRRKLAWLRIAGLFLGLGVLAVGAALWVYLKG